MVVINGGMNRLGLNKKGNLYLKKEKNYQSALSCTSVMIWKSESFRQPVRRAKSLPAE